ncbi:OmpA family protein [Pseudomonas sp. N040]|uniref:OmpA family protein n=1 Tax=Pseudomonas sp. N040 TaxID=2785325 RepID=UPI0018A2DA9E|nr:OmpA family protein [Pseudomonas sp. N040]MBF7728761.1 OmpA family protein [Pseudomonas sp. N040]MBW7012401.1 OmpA family protein [Pseudomonas sp. N040]
MPLFSTRISDYRGAAALLLACAALAGCSSTRSEGNAWLNQGNWPLCTVLGLICYAQDGDQDGDGVFDRRDQCADTPTGSAVQPNGCAPQAVPPAATEQIVLLPNRDGSPSALLVKTAAGEQLLDRPYAAAVLLDDGQLLATEQGAATVNATYAEALAAQPQRPASYELYFVSGEVQLTADSRLTLQRLQADLQARAVPEITAIGHTDSVGDDAYNDALSLQRAEAMRNLLVAEGVSDQHFSVVGVGEREPLVPSADGVAEAKNRRVEINLR